MNKPPSEVGQLLYQAQMRFTEQVAYGFDLEGLFSGRIPIPPGGVRYDIHFEGTCQGPRISGEIKGVDYVYLRADGQPQLHIHARLTTDDGVDIAISASGISFHKEDEEHSRFQVAIDYHTAAEDYLWINQLQGLGLGVIDGEAGQFTIEVYSN